MHCAEAVAPAKVILVGEHFVVWGSKALATAVGLYARVRLTRRPGPSRVIAVSRELGVRVSVWPRCEGHLCQLGAVIEAARKLGVDLDGSVEARIESDIPPSAGLGSSAAVASAFAAALLELAGREPRPETVSMLAFEAEKVVHGRPSGIDNTVTSHGGTVVYRVGGEFQLYRTRLGEARLIVVDTGLRRSTGDAVKRALRVSEVLGRVKSELLRLVDGLVDEALAAALRGDLERLGTIMNFAHGLLHGIGVTNHAIDSVVHSLRRVQGVVGAKVTGAGLGGVVVALAVPGMAGRIAEELKLQRLRVLVAEPEVEGVRAWSCTTQ